MLDLLAELRVKIIRLFSFWEINTMIKLKLKFIKYIEDKWDKEINFEYDKKYSDHFGPFWTVCR